VPRSRGSRCICLGLATPLLVAMVAGVVPFAQGRSVPQGQARPRGGPAPAQASSGRLGSLHHKIRTTKPEAQTLFDQGLTFFYGFNRGAARRAFERAAALDPAAAMPLVGMALAAGPNLNSDPSPADIKAGCAAARRAAALARDPDETGYAKALAGRYCAGLTFDRATGYAIDMGELFQRFEADPDAATLYADSLMSLRPRSAEQNVELVAVLEHVLTRWPNHVGANHYYIHAVEGSRRPERALPSARRLETLVPAIGHLLHMPAHIYSRMGDQPRAIQANERAVAADEAYMRANGVDDEQLMYYHHDLESLAVAAGASGRFAVAHRAGTLAAKHGAAKPPAAAHFSPILGFVLLRFSRWEEALRLPAPSTAEPPNPVWYHFTRAVANAQLRRRPAASTERDSFQRLANAVPADAIYRQNPARRVMEVASAILDARLAAARGESAAAIQAWERAVAAQDRLVYHEPPPVYYSVRESLGAALHGAGRLAQAEAVFREDLTRNPRSGRSLFGLWQTLLALGRRAEADAAKRAFDETWVGSDTTLSLADF
jgi:tetratricopeptide (TPR) repeat protein